MSKRRDVQMAVKALVSNALPNAKVRGFDTDAAKPARSDPGGDVIGHPGDPGDPEIDLSPLTYHYAHRFPIEIAAPTSAGDQDEVIDEMMGAIGGAVEADRTLGDLCDWLEVEAPDVNDRSIDGAESPRWAELAIIARYATHDPLN